jgi:hypothetical protein
LSALAYGLEIGDDLHEIRLDALGHSERTEKSLEGQWMPWIREQTSMDFSWRWLCAGLAGLFVLTGSASGDEFGPRPLDIYFIDVMGGAATLIVTPEKESILIDSGWPGFEDRDPRRIVHVLKNLAGCDHLDHLVTTHWHVDHFGGVAGLAKAIEIKHFWDKGGAPATVKRLRGIPSIKAAYQLHRNAETSSEDNTDPGLIANLDPTGGQFIHVSVTPDGSKFHVQIGPDGPRREFASR